MKLELKNIKVNERLSEETYCFTATLFINGKATLFISNRGHGGPNDYGNPKPGMGNAYEKVAEIDAYLKASHPPDTTCGKPMDYCLDFFCSDAISDFMLMKKVRRYTKNGSTCVWADTMEKGQFIQLAVKWNPEQKERLVSRIREALKLSESAQLVIYNERL